MIKKIRLFCVPYAGGSALVYNKWEPLLSAHIALHPVELAGKGERAGEELYRDAAAAVDDVYRIIAANIDGPYALFGHSMGAMLAYEAAQAMRRNGKPQPVHVFVSGRAAPHVASKRMQPYHLMPEETFRDEVMKLGGTPPEFFRYPELLGYMLPILRNDFRLSETLPLHTVVNPLGCGLTVFSGKEEKELTAEGVHGWMAHTTRVCNVHYFNGGHFFINNETERMLQIINATLISA